MISQQRGKKERLASRAKADRRSRFAVGIAFYAESVLIRETNENARLSIFLLIIGSGGYRRRQGRHFEAGGEATVNVTKEIRRRLRSEVNLRLVVI